MAASALSLPALASAQSAADDWSGTYLGFGTSYLELDTDQISPAQRTARRYLKGSYGGDHHFGFAQAEVRRQSGNLVWGLRLRHQMTNSDGDSYVMLDETISTKPMSMTTLSATLGYVVQPKLLVYGAAGASYGRFDYGSVDYRWEQVDDSLKASRRGLSASIGAEYKLTERVSVFTEYTYTQFATGSSTFVYPPPSVTSQWTYEFDHSYRELSVGMNYRF